MRIQTYERFKVQSCCATRDHLRNSLDFATARCNEEKEHMNEMKIDDLTSSGFLLSHDIPPCTLSPIPPSGFFCLERPGGCAFRIIPPIDSRVTHTNMFYFLVTLAMRQNERGTTVHAGHVCSCIHYRQRSGRIREFAFPWISVGSSDT